MKYVLLCSTLALLAACGGKEPVGTTSSSSSSSTSSSSSSNSGSSSSSSTSSSSSSGDGELVPGALTNAVWELRYVENELGIRRASNLGAHAKFESISAKDLETIGFASSAAAVYGHFFNETNDDTPIDRKFRAALPSFPATDFDTEVDLQIELSALALSRNVTNVVTLMWGEQQGEFYLPESFTEIRSDFHSAIHTASRQSYAIFRAYLSAKLAYLIQLLEVMRDEDNRSLLETTLVVHVSDQGDGDNHDGTNPPYFIAGSKNLFRNGAVVNAGGASQYDLMDTIAEAYGLQGVQYGTKKIEGLTRV